jgi:glutamate synthase domain-containing protein 2
MKWLLSIRTIIGLALLSFYALIADLLSKHFYSGIVFAILLVALSVLYVYNIFQVKHSILRNYPIVGYLRYFFESFRPEFRQYFFESDLDGKPFNRRQRSIVYQRAKNVRQTVPFGMQVNSLEVGYEWLSHTLFPVHIGTHDLRVTVGEQRCSQPYSASILNISAMSYGSLSKTAIQSLNEGARLGGFAHNTGEGGVSPYHLEGGGDLIWQIGTGYFGCRNADGTFNDELFAEQVKHPNIKMIEIKLSQGAKPGHGGILPAAKNTPEIAAIRKVEPFTTVASPPAHSAFGNYDELCLFIEKLRLLSNGKPVGIKLCVGSKKEFSDMIMTMKKHWSFPDFISIDGAEGGTGAAPLEFSDSLGMPLYDALSFAHQTLVKSGVRNELRLFAAGKIITGIDIIKVISLGADACYSARGMMFSLGCIQALKCDSGKCPVGIATQEKVLYQGVDIEDKRIRVKNFHNNTLKSTVEVMEACGYQSLNDIKPENIYRRLPDGGVASFKEIYFDKNIAFKHLETPELTQ